jgi:hypothetical protein
MKTSNKLLLSLLAIIIVGIFIVNVVLKRQMDKREKTKTSVEVKSINAADSDSIAMEKAVDNE